MVLLFASRRVLICITLGCRSENLGKRSRVVHRAIVYLMELYILYRCKLPNLENDSYAVQGQYHEDLINATVPILPDGSYDKCKIIVNGTLEPCSEWVYDESIFANTVSSQVNLFS